MGFMAYNENGEYQEYETYERKIKCTHCGREYNQWVEEQVPGNRDVCSDICPYCGKENGRSGDEEYHNSKIGE